MDVLPSNQLPAEPEPTMRRFRLRRAAALCSLLCLGLLIASYFIDIFRMQAVASVWSADALARHQADRMWTEALRYLSQTIGVFGCILGWTVPIIQTSMLGEPFNHRKTKVLKTSIRIAVIVSLVLASFLILVVLAQPWILDALEVTPSSLPYRYWEPPVNIPWPFYGAYRVLLRFYDRCLTLEFIIFIINIFYRLYLIAGPSSREKAELPPAAGDATRASKLSTRLIIHRIFYVFYYATLLLASFWNSVSIFFSAASFI